MAMLTSCGPSPEFGFRAFVNNPGRYHLWGSSPEIIVTRVRAGVALRTERRVWWKDSKCGLWSETSKSKRCLCGWLCDPGRVIYLASPCLTLFMLEVGIIIVTS